MQAPPSILPVEIMCFATTLAAFLLTNLRPRTYERWHALGLHVAPGLWSTIVAAHHIPLYASLFDLAS